MTISKKTSAAPYPAIIDRTVHHGRMIRFEGESYRKTHALMQ